MLDRNEATHSINYRAGEHRGIVAALHGMPRKCPESEDPDYTEGFYAGYDATVNELGNSEEDREYRHGFYTGNLKRRQNCKLGKKEIMSKCSGYEEKSTPWKRGFEEGIERTSKKRPYEEISQSDGEMPQPERESKRRKFEEYVRAWENGVRAYNSGNPLKVFAKNEPEQNKLAWKYGHEYAASQRPRDEDEQAKVHGETAARGSFNRALRNGRASDFVANCKKTWTNNKPDAYTESYNRTVEALAKLHGVTSSEFKQAGKNTTQSQQSSTSLIETKMVSAVSDDASTNNPQPSDKERESLVKREKRLAKRAVRVTFWKHYDNGTLSKFLLHLEHLLSSKKSKDYVEAYHNEAKRLLKQHEEVGNLESKEEVKRTEELSKRNEVDNEQKKEKPKSAALNNIGFFNYKPHDMPASNTQHLNNSESKQQGKSIEQRQMAPAVITLADIITSKKGDVSFFEHGVTNLPEEVQLFLSQIKSVVERQNQGQENEVESHPDSSEVLVSKIKLIVGRQNQGRENEVESYPRSSFDEYQLGWDGHYERAASLHPRPAYGTVESLAKEHEVGGSEYNQVEKKTKQSQQGSTSLTETKMASAVSDDASTNNPQVSDKERESLVKREEKRLAKRAVRTTPALYAPYRQHIDSSKTAYCKTIHKLPSMPAGNTPYLDSPSEQKEKKTKQGTEGSAERPATPSARGSLMLFDPRTLSMANNANHEIDADEQEVANILAGLKGNGTRR